MPGQRPRMDPTISRCLAMRSVMPLSASASKPVERVAAERLGLRRALDLDEAAVAGLDDVHVDVGLRVLFVGEIEQRHAGDDADAGGGDVVGDRNGAQLFLLPCSLPSASTSATNAPVIDAQRVPPSAWITSQSSQIVRSPSSSSLITDRIERPISR